jgi:hypothetical protein
MRVLIVLYLLFVVYGLLAQSREEKLEQLKSREGIKVTEIEKNILRLEYPSGKVLYKNIFDYRLPVTDNLNYSPTYDSTIIDLRYIDTMLYYKKYSFLQEVDVGSPQTKPPLVGDLNNNGLSEIYGQKKGYISPDFSNYIVLMEMNNQGGFDSVYSYDSTRNALTIYDVDKDGMNELHLRRFIDYDTIYGGNNYLFFNKLSDTSFATDLSFIFYPFPENNQLDNNTFGVWDGDEFTDQIFIRDCCPPSIYVYEYSPIINNFDSVYQFEYSSLDLEYGGFSVGDFDQDNKTEFFAGGTHGKVLCIETNGNNSYVPSWQGMVETYNAYQLAQTNDIDRNGKKEIWIGGDAFYPGIGPMTRITIFEANSNDNYQVVGRIDLIGIFSLYAQNYQAVDVDKDGIEEMMVCIEETVLILKFNGSPNHQTYDLFYFKQNDLMLAGRNSVYYGAKMYDITNDGKEDIIIHLDEIVVNVGMRLFTFIYEADFTLGVNNSYYFPEKYSLYPNYPNPFNPSTKIRFDIPEYSKVSIKVYNILGKEITTMLEKEFSPGSYTLSWEGRDSNGKLLPSGVYLIQLHSGNYTKTIKALLLR